MNRCVPQINAFKAGFRSEILDNLAMTHSLVTVTDRLSIGNGKQPQNVVGELQTDQFITIYHLFTNKKALKTPRGL